MGSVTISNGLTIVIPSKGTLNWNDQVVTAMKAISGHDHTGSGKGNPITTAALAAKCVTVAKIADGVITGDQIADNSIPSTKIIGGTGGDAAAVITGTILMTMNTAAPATYALLKGQIVSQTGAYATLFGTAGWGDKWVANWGQGNEGAGNWRLPDFTRRMPIGYDGVIGNVGTVGGSWNHVHIAPAHAHTLSNHTHVGGLHHHDLSNHVHLGGAHVHLPGSLRAQVGINGADSIFRMNQDGVNTFHATAKFALLNTGGVSSDSATSNSTVVQGVTEVGGGDANTGVPSNNQSGDAGNVTSNGPSVDSTSTAGAGATDSANGPYIITNFMVKL